MTRKYEINDAMMDFIDSQEKAYWLGFFYADAYNHEKRGRVVIELAESDSLHLFKCARFFGRPRDPFLQSKNKGKYSAYRLELNSKYLTKSLSDKGCHQNKSYNLTFPDFLSKDLERHFIRGYFDGDGSIYIHQDQLHIQFVSTKEFNLQLKKILLDMTINSYLDSPARYQDNTCRLSFGGSRQVRRFMEWLYQDATVYLDRKKDTYDKYCQNHKFRFDYIPYEHA